MNERRLIATGLRVQISQPQLSIAEGPSDNEIRASHMAECALLQLRKRSCDARRVEINESSSLQKTQKERYQREEEDRLESTQMQHGRAAQLCSNDTKKEKRSTAQIFTSRGDAGRGGGADDSLGEKTFQ